MGQIKNIKLHIVTDIKLFRYNQRRNMTEISSWITGHHVYKRVWTPRIGEKLYCRPYQNKVDPRAVVVFKGSTLVGHAPREHKERFYRHLKNGGRINVVVTGGRNNSRLRGLEVSANYILS